MHGLSNIHELMKRLFNTLYDIYGILLMVGLFISAIGFIVQELNK